MSTSLLGLPPQPPEVIRQSQPPTSAMMAGMDSMGAPGQASESGAPSGDLVALVGQIANLVGEAMGIAKVVAPNVLPLFGHMVQAGSMVEEILKQGAEQKGAGAGSGGPLEPVGAAVANPGGGVPPGM